MVATLKYHLLETITAVLILIMPPIIGKQTLPTITTTQGSMTVMPTALTQVIPVSAEKVQESEETARPNFHLLHHLQDRLRRNNSLRSKCKYSF